MMHSQPPHPDYPDHLPRNFRAAWRKQVERWRTLNSQCEDIEREAALVRRAVLDAAEWLARTARQAPDEKAAAHSVLNALRHAIQMAEGAARR